MGVHSSSLVAAAQLCIHSNIWPMHLSLWG
jgi:hypothetical protein